MNRVSKGHYGYLKYKKRLQLIKTIIGGMGVLVLLMVGYITTHSTKNLLTVMAVLTVLPTANVAVTLIAMLPYKGRSREEYEEIKSITNNGILDCELALTSSKYRTMPIDYCYVHPDGVFFYTSQEKLDANATKQYIKVMLENNGLDSKIFIFKNLSDYKNKLKKLSVADRETCDEQLLKIENIIQCLSL